MSTENSRPLSPHIQVYRPQLTSMLSILHRATGFGLAFSLFFLVGWLACMAMGESTYTTYMGFLQGYFGQTVLYLTLFAFYYHLLNGIRHLFWDMGWGFEISSTYKSGWVTFFLSILATIITWRII